MEKEILSLQVTEIDNGYSVEITGENADDILKDKVKACCVNSSDFKDVLASCCTDGK